jgi:Secretion system C-terminal sorting domain
VLHINLGNKRYGAQVNATTNRCWERSCAQDEAPEHFIQWNGLYQDGEEAIQTGVYMYVIELENCHGSRTITGNITATCTGEFRLTESTPPLLDIILYPNPTTDGCYIESKNVQIDEFEVYSIDGVNVKKNQQNVNAAQVYVDLSDLPPNTYLIKVKSN